MGESWLPRQMQMAYLFLDHARLRYRSRGLFGFVGHGSRTSATMVATNSQ